MSAAAAPSPARRRRFRALAICLILALAVWFLHEPVLVWSVRKAVDTFLPRLGLKLDVGRMQIHLFRPIEFSDVRFRVTNPPASRTDARLDRFSLRAESVWEWLFGDGRIFRRLEVSGLSGTFDFRREALIPQPIPTLSRPQQEQLCGWILRFLPKALVLKNCGATFLADNQSYTVQGVDGTFSETDRGRLTVQRVDIRAGSIHQELSAGQATTAWKEGALYLSDLKVRDDIVIRNFVANFVNIGGISLDWDLGAYGGTIRGSIVFGSENDELLLQATTAIVNMPVAALPGLLALPAKTEGIIRDARLTFRGNPDHRLDNEISLRVSADNFRWNERGWQSLVIGANYIGRRLYLSGFDLTQADNRISANGELAVPDSLTALPKATYLVNVAADVRDLASLAALAGPPFDQLVGQVYAHGSFKGDAGQLTGYLTAQASGLRYENLPIASANLSIIAQNEEFQIRYADLWAGPDRIEARGSLGIRSPHAYAGEFTAKIADLGLYTPFGGEAVAQNVFSGAATVEWQGDGTLNAHSGSLRARLVDVITSATPTGLTGEFAGTYSPQNVHLSTVRLNHGPLQLDSQVTLSASGVNIRALTLQRGKLGLLNGEAFVPLNAFALAAGRSLADALAENAPLYANFTSGDLPVADLVQMVGQHASVGGRLRLNLGASGTLAQPLLAGQLTGRDLTAKVEDFALPPATADLQLATREGKLALDGALRIRGFQPLTVTGSLPVGYEELPDGLVRFFRPDAPLTARLDFPGTSLEILRPFLPPMRRLQGTLAGRLDVQGTPAAPRITGEASLENGDIEVNDTIPRVTQLAARLHLETTRITLETLRGEIGAGPFSASGAADLTDPAAPKLDLQLKGTKILLARDAGMRLRADVDLRATGRADAGSLTGTISLVDGRIFRRLEVTPLLVPNPVSGGPAFVPPDLTGLVPPPWAAWKLGVTIRDGAPFLLVGNLATGEISPDLTLGGTLGAPLLTGTISLRNLQAYLPASTLLIPEGRIYLTAENPLMPIMDVRARADVSGYTVQMYAYGPLSESRIALRSDPPLSQENLIFLLTTGLTPAGMSGADLGEAAAGQGGILLLRSLARQLEPMGLDLNGLVNRLSVRVIPATDPSQAASLRSELRLTDRFALTTGRDGFGFYNAGVQYTLRFR